MTSSYIFTERRKDSMNWELRDTALRARNDFRAASYLPECTDNKHSSSDKGLRISMRVLMIFFCFFGNVIICHAEKIYKKANEKILVFDDSKNLVYNQADFCEDLSQYLGEGYDVKNWHIVKEIVKSTLSEYRLKELSKEVFCVTFLCDYEGNIESIRFYFPKEFFLTVDEIEKLESAFKAKKFSLDVPDKSKKGVLFGGACRLSRL